MSAEPAAATETAAIAGVNNNNDDSDGESKVRVDDVEEQQQQFITYDDFSRVRLRIGRVISAESIPRMKKVFKVRVDLGTEQRNIAIGAAQYYKPEEFVGKIVVVCINLEPRKLGDVISQGMLLSAEGPGGKPVFLTIPDEVPLGAPIG